MTCLIHAGNNEQDLEFWPHAPDTPRIMQPLSIVIPVYYIFIHTHTHVHKYIYISHWINVSIVPERVLYLIFTGLFLCHCPEWWFVTLYIHADTQRALVSIGMDVLSLCMGCGSSEATWAPGFGEWGKVSHLRAAWALPRTDLPPCPQNLCGHHRCVDVCICLCRVWAKKQW